MSLRTSLTVLKLSTVVLLSSTVAFAVKFYKVLEEKEQLKETIKIDKETYVNDLKEIFTRYDDEVQKNRDLNESKKNNPRHQNIIYVPVRPTQKKKELIVKSDKNSEEYDKIIKKQIEENRLLENQINHLSQKNEELERQNAENVKLVSRSMNLTATNVNAEGVKVVKNEIVATKFSNSTDQIKVCFTLMENKAALQGYKDLYLQIVNPKNKVVFQNGTEHESTDKLLNYSAKTNVFYDNEELDVCVFIEPKKADVVQGDYEINIYSGINLIGSAVFSLK